MSAQSVGEEITVSSKSSLSVRSFGASYPKSCRRVIKSGTNTGHCTTQADFLLNGQATHVLLWGGNFFSNKLDPTKAVPHPHLGNA